MQALAEKRRRAARLREQGRLVNDETGLRSDDMRGRSYAPKGETPMVRVNSKRENAGLILIATNQGKMRGIVLDGALDSNIFLNQ